MDKNSLSKSETYYSELEAYKRRLYNRINKEAKKYGYTFEQVEQAYRMSPLQRQENADQHYAYYTQMRKLKEAGDSPKEIANKTFLLKPTLPDPLDFGEYLEYARVEQLLTGNPSTGRKL